MSFRVGLEFTDGQTSIFRELSTVSHGLVKQGLSVTASKIAEEYKKHIKAETPSDWSTFNYNGKKRMTLEDKKAVFGTKHSRKTGEAQDLKSWANPNIADHVTFYTPKEMDKMYAVIGGGHKGFYPVEWTNGVATGHKNYVRPTSQKTLAILDGLNDGKVIILSEKSRILLASAKGGRGVARIGKTINIKPRRFAEAARRTGGSIAIAKIKEIYDRNFDRAIANIQIKEKKVKIS